MMDEAKFTAARMDTNEWYVHTRTWNPSQYYDAIAVMHPCEAKAGQASDWQIEVLLGDMVLEPGDHVALELNVSWTLDGGRPFDYGRLTIQEEWNPGYGATPVFCFPEGVAWEMAVTEPKRMNRYFIIDAVIQKGVVPRGGKFYVSLANPDGSLIRCPRYAQVVHVPVAVRKKDSTVYMRIREIPHVIVTGGLPVMWKAAVTLMPGHQSVFVRVTGADAWNRNPCSETQAPRVLSSGGWAMKHFARKPGYQGADLWTGIAEKRSQGKSGFSRGSGQFVFFNRSQGLYGRSNPILPLYDGMQVYFGDLHGQSDRSIGFGSEEEYFSWARDAEMLDFVAPANHYGGRKTDVEALWKDTLELCDDFYRPGEFATLYSYEWGGGRNAHRNIYYGTSSGKLFDAHDERYRDINLLWDQLDRQRKEVLTIPHHTKFISRIDWREHHPGYQRLVEVCSCWGNSEEHGPHSVQTALRMGHRLGVVGGTDTHFSQPGRPAFGPNDYGGMTGVICEKLERDSIWKALYERRCYATTGERILLRFDVNKTTMGGELPPCENRLVSGHVAGTAPLEWVEIVCNGCIWKRYELDNRWEMTFSVVDDRDFNHMALEPEVGGGGRFIYYYLRTRQRDGHWAMSSPIWMSEGVKGENGR